MTDPFNHPDFLRWAGDVLTNLVPKIEGSSVAVSLVPQDEGDVKFAVELGLSIMLDKPIILAVHPGQRIPDHLVRAADEIVELDADGKLTGLSAAINRVLAHRDDRGAGGAR